MRDQPLGGRRVLVTRAREQAEALARALVERGAVPIELSTIRFEAPDNWESVDRVVRQLDRYDWIVFTSANGVRFFFDRRESLATRRPGSVRAQLGAIGPATARAIEDRGHAVSFVPSSFVAEAIVVEMAGLGVQGKQILLPRAREARDVLAIGLSQLGARVDEVAVYQTMPTGDPADARRLLDPASPDRPEIVTLTSSSTARHFVALLGMYRAQLLQGVTVASIGPITSQTAREQGLTVQVESAEHTIAGLVRALESFYRRGDL